MVEAGRRRPSQVGVQGREGTMASMGTINSGTWSTTPTVSQTGGTRMVVPTGRSGGTTKGPPLAHARRSDRGSSGDGSHPHSDGAGILLAWDACRCE